MLGKRVPLEVSGQRGGRESGAGRRCGNPRGRGLRPSPSACPRAGAGPVNIHSRRPGYASVPDVQRRRNSEALGRCRDRRRAGSRARTRRRGELRSRPWSGARAAHRSRLERPYPGRSTATRCAASASRSQVGSKAYRLSGRWAQQEGVIVSDLALGVADRQPVDRPELRLDGAVQPGARSSGRVWVAFAQLASASGQ